MGVLGLATVVMVGRRQGPDEYAQFAVLWAAFFGIGGCLSGLQQEVIRSLRVERRDRSRGSQGALLPVALLVAAPVVVVGTLSLSHLDTSPQGAPWRLIAAACGFAWLVVLTYVCGVFAAQDNWRNYAFLLTADALVRTGALALLLGVDRSPWISLGVVASAGLLPICLGFPAVRAAMRAALSGSPRDFAVRTWNAMGAAACAALLIAGYPFLVALAGDPLPAQSGPLLAALVLVRAPLVFVVFAFRPLVLRSVVDSDDPPARAVRIVAATVVAGLPIALAVGLAGPWVLRVLLGVGFHVDGPDLVVVAFGALLVATLVTSGVALIALDRHSQSLGGWALALVGSVTVMALAEGTTSLILAPQVVGPILGLAVHGCALVRCLRQSKPMENADSRSCWE